VKSTSQIHPRVKVGKSPDTVTGKERKKTNDARREQILEERDRRAETTNRDPEIVQLFGIHPEPRSGLMGVSRRQLAPERGERDLARAHRPIHARRTQLERGLERESGETHRVERSTLRCRSQRAPGHHRFDESASFGIHRLERLDRHCVKHSRFDACGGEARLFDGDLGHRRPELAKLDGLGLRAHPDDPDQGPPADQRRDEELEIHRNSPGGIERGSRGQRDGRRGRPCAREPTMRLLWPAEERSAIVGTTTCGTCWWWELMLGHKLANLHALIG